jgi:hypothetical protein
MDFEEYLSNGKTAIRNFICNQMCLFFDSYMMSHILQSNDTYINDMTRKQLGNLFIDTAKLIVPFYKNTSSSSSDSALRNMNQILLISASSFAKNYMGCIRPYSNNFTKTLVDNIIREYAHVFEDLFWCSWNAATIIQKHYRLAIYHPDYLMCQKRLMKEYHDLIHKDI